MFPDYLSVSYDYCFSVFASEHTLKWRKKKIDWGWTCLEKVTKAKLSMQYIIKNNLQQRKETVVFISEIRVSEMACYLWWCDWRDCMSDVRVLGGALFFKLLPKTSQKKNSALFFRVSLRYLNNVITKLFPEQIQNSGIFRTPGIRGTLSQRGNTLATAATGNILNIIGCVCG